MATEKKFTLILNGNINNTLVQSFNKCSVLMQRFNMQSIEIKNNIIDLNNAYQNGSISAEDYTSKLKSLKAAQTDINRSKVNVAMDNVAKSGIALRNTVGIMKSFATPFAGIVKTAANFEAAMTRVGVISGATGKDFEMLKSKAMELGNKTAFSSTEVAEAMKFLGMAGWETNQILAGTKPMLDLAVVGGTDLALTADIVSDNLTAFGMSADKAGHLADVYANVITKTNTDVRMLGETMKYAAPVADAFGASMEETSAMAGLMASAGVKASQAGTSLRAGFLRLAGPPKKATKELEELGISLEDSAKGQALAEAQLANLGIRLTDNEGKTRKMVTIIQELAAKTQGMGKQEKLAALQAIFGTTAATGWLNVINQGPEKLATLAAELENPTKKVGVFADEMSKTTKGAAVEFESAVENLSISIGNTFLPPVTKAVKKMTSFARGLNQNSEVLATLGAVALGTVGSLGILVATVQVGKLVYDSAVLAKKSYVWWTEYELKATVMAKGEKWLEVAATLAQTKAHWAYAAGVKVAAGAQWMLNTALWGFPVMWVIAGIAGIIGAVYMLYKHWNTVTQFCSKAWDWFCNNIVYGVGYIVGWFQTLPERITAYFNAIDGDSFVEKAINWGQSAVDGIVSWFMSMPERISNIISSMWNRIKLGFFAGQETAKAEVQHNATGGIYGKGAFLTTFAENSGESAIPHTPNVHNIGLLAKTNEIMGNPLGGNNISVNFAPVINASGSADASAIQSAIADERRKLETMLRDLMNQQRRLSYA